MTESQKQFLVKLLNEPSPSGENATVTVHEADGDNVCPEQMSAGLLKGEAGEETDVTVNADAPLFVTVMSRVAELPVPMFP